MKPSPFPRRRAVVAISTLALAASAATFGGQAAMAAGPVQASIYVSPTGNDGNPGSQSQPVQTLQKAQQMVRGMNSAMSGDIQVVLEDGFYQMTAPLTLTAADSGTNGHDVVWTADSGAHPIVAGSDQISGWTLHDSARNIWVAQGPSGIQTRQLYVNGVRATRATGPVPSAATLSSWVDPSGHKPSEVEFVYSGGLGAWTEPRCPVASATATAITMAQPCWDDVTKRGTNHVGPGVIGSPSRAENAYALLNAPGEWYLDNGDSKFYYMSQSGESPATEDFEAPVLEALVNGGGTSTNPLHNVDFNGIEFAYATWLGPSTGNGFPEVQANYLVWGSPATQGDCQFGGSCPFAAWYQTPADVYLSYDQHIQFTNDVFAHLGGAGLGLSNGSQNDLVQGNLITDTSGNGFELGNDNMPTATGNDQTLNNQVLDNLITHTPVEFHGGIGLDVGYAANTLVSHNQVDHTPYSGMSFDWGGWPDKVAQPGETNYSENNTISNNVVEFVMNVLADGALIYTNGQTSATHQFATGEKITGNVLHDQLNHGHAVYTDNGTDWMTITGNAVWNTGAANSWGHCHNDYYPGEGGGVDWEIVQGNYWSSGPTNAPDAHCQVSGNTVISGPSQVPASIIANAGLESAYQGLLSVPMPPDHGRAVGHCPASMAAPTGVTGAAATGQVMFSWTAPAADCTGPATYYAIYVYGSDASAQTVESATNSVSVTGLTSGTYYTATVTAFDTARWSVWSAWAPWTLVA